MRLLFVAQENKKVSKGTVRIWTTLYQSWPKDTQITVLLNHIHWAVHDLTRDLKGHPNVDYVRFPFRIPSDWVFNLFSSQASKSVKILRILLYSLLNLLISPFIIFGLAWWLRQQKFDGILSHNGGWPAGDLNRWIIYAGLIARIPRRVLVIHNLPVKPHPMMQLFAWMRDCIIGYTATDLVTVSNSCKTSLQTLFSQPLKVLYNGISIHPPSSSTMKRLKKLPIVGFVGEISPRKGVHLLLEAMQQVTEPCEVLLIGTGESNYLENLQSLAKKSPWEIHFLGFQEEVTDFYSLFDILVLPSINFESFGMVLVEAMMHEKPVICSDFGGMKEVVKHGDTGLVVESGSPEALASALNALLRDQDLRQKMGKAGRKRLEQHFSAETMTKQYVELFV